MPEHKLHDSLERCIQTQKDAVAELEKTLKDIDTWDLLRENTSLQETLRSAQENLARQSENVLGLQKDNEALRIALRNQLAAEKSRIVSKESQRIAAYFASERQGQANRLADLEQRAQKRLQALRDFADTQIGQEKTSVFESIDALQKQIEDQAQNMRQALEVQFEQELAKTQAESESLADEPVSEEALQKRIRENDVEIKIGMSWVNKAGIAVLLLGFLFGIQYTYTHIGDLMKSVLLFGAGAALLVVGEVLHRRFRGPFSLGITGGGIGALYIALYMSYFYIRIIDNAAVALALCVLITAVSFFLSLRYCSQTITAFALVGGFLPVLVLHRLGANLVYAAYVYFFALNLLALLIAQRKTWPVINYISFWLNLPCLIYLNSLVGHNAAALLYSAATYFLYLGMIMGYPLRKRVKLLFANTLLLMMSTIAYSLLIASIIAWNPQFQQVQGLSALLFTGAFAVLYMLARRRIPQEKGLIGLFLTTAITFSLLIVPVQFGWNHTVLAWAGEATGLILYAKVKKVPPLLVSGWVMLGVSGVIVGLQTLVVMAQYILSGDLPSVEYILNATYFMAGVAILFWAYRREMAFDHVNGSRDLRLALELFKCAGIAAFWAYVVFMIVQAQRLDIVKPSAPYIPMAVCLVSAAYGLGVLRMGKLASKGSDVIAGMLSIGAFVGTLSLNYRSAYDRLLSGQPVVSAVCLGLVNALVLLVAVDFFRTLVNKTKLDPSWYPLGSSIYALLLITANLTGQYNFSVQSIVLSVIYLVMALLWVLYGFGRGIARLRRCGLVLTLLALTKLFLVDLWGLSAGKKIIAYFIFGALLLAISYVYQRYAKRLLLPPTSADPKEPAEKTEETTEQMEG